MQDPDVDRAGRRPDRIRPAALSPACSSRDLPPFEKIFDDHGIYLRALLGQDVDSAIAHFQAKLDEADERTAKPTVPAAQTLVNLLVHGSGRLDAAIDVASQHLAGFSESSAGVSRRRAALPAGRPARAAGADRPRTRRPGEFRRRHCFSPDRARRDLGRPRSVNQGSSTSGARDRPADCAGLLVVLA